MLQKQDRLTRARVTRAQPNVIMGHLGGRGAVGRLARLKRGPCLDKIACSRLSQSLADGKFPEYQTAFWSGQTLPAGASAQGSGTNAGC